MKAFRDYFLPRITPRNSNKHKIQQYSIAKPYSEDNAYSLTYFITAPTFLNSREFFIATYTIIA